MISHQNGANKFYLLFEEAALVLKQGVVIG